MKQGEIILYFSSFTSKIEYGIIQSYRNTIYTAFSTIEQSLVNLRIDTLLHNLINSSITSTSSSYLKV